MYFVRSATPSFARYIHVHKVYPFFDNFQWWKGIINNKQSVFHMVYFFANVICLSLWTCPLAVSIQV